MSLNFNQNFTDIGWCMGNFASLNGQAGAIDNTPASKWGAAGPTVRSRYAMYQGLEQRLAGSGGGSGLIQIIPSIASLAALNNLGDNLQSATTAHVTDGQLILITRVNADNPQPNSSLTTALIEWIRQMESQSVTVKACTVSQTTTAGASNTGNANVICTLTDPNGLTLENVFAESIRLICTTDSKHGGTAGSEQITLTSPAAVNPITSYKWPGGSGLSSTLTVIDPTLGNGSSTGQNMLTGSLTASNVGAFKAWSGATPVGWTVSVGTVSDGTTNAYNYNASVAATAHCLKIAGDSSTLTTLYQSFANTDATGSAVTGGSTAVLLPGTIYHFSVHVKADVVPAAGTLQFSLTDGNGTVLNNNAGTAQTITSVVSSYGGVTYQTVSGSFQTPTIMPSTGCRLQVKASVAISTGTNVYVDFIMLAQASSVGPALVGSGGSSSGYGGLYNGGPYMSIVRGSVDVVNWVSPTLGDQWTVAISNDRAASSPTPLSFQTLFDVFYSLRDKGLILPSAASPTIANSLIP